MKKKLLAVLTLVASLSLVTACTAANDSPVTPIASESSAPLATVDPGTPTPEISGVPEVVATVNGEKISKADFVRIYEGQFEQVLMQAQMAGQKIDQAQLRIQTAEGLVSTELLIQQAAKKEIHATADDLEAALNDIAASNNTDRAGFLASMEQTGLDEKAVKIQIRTQLEVERLLANELGDFKPSEAELKAAYELLAKEQKAKKGEVPAFADTQAELAQQLKIQKEAAAVKSYVEKLRKGAKVTVNM